MAKDSKIEWTHHTFNPWWGCAKVSPACLNCYAEAWAKRVGSKVWGKNADRRFFGANHWKEPVSWNAEAVVQKQRRRVFCASMADVFERRPELKPWRQKLWELINATPMLDWLILTKRPQNISSMVPWGDDEWPKNIWIGTTVENQHWAEVRLPHLLKHSAAVRFLSCEPLLGPIDLGKWAGDPLLNPLDWVIAGGESGPQARPMEPGWARKLRDHCNSHGIPFHFKQWGHWVPAALLEGAEKRRILVGEVEMAAAGKKLAGRELDGKTWDQFPITTWNHE